MGQKPFIVLFWTIFSTSVSSQTVPRAIYIGEINCGRTNAAQKSDKETSVSLFGHHLMDSANAIEIFLTEHGIGPMSYTREVRLYYNNGFKIQYWDTNFHLDTTTFQFPVIQKRPSGKFPLDSIFSLLVTNGAFQLPHLSQKEIKKIYKYSFVINNKIVTDSLKMSVADGSEFLFEFKIGNCYGRHVFNNPQAFHDHNPDIQIFRRQSEIIRALFLNLD